MNVKYVAVPLMCGGLVLGLAASTSFSAQADNKARTTVTIQALNTDLSGTIKSPKPGTCAADRKVLLIKQKGKRGGGDDKRISSDTASLEMGVYTWSTGNTGIEGKFYAKVKATRKCQGDTSPTVRAKRSDN